MFILSCEPATCAIPDWHKELFRGQEETVISQEGWSPGALNLAQAFATKLRILLAHGDITRLLVEFGCHPNDPARFSRFSMTLSEDQRHKLDERHHLAYLNLIKQRVREELRKTGIALHLSIRTESTSGLPTIELVHDPTRDFESNFVGKWATSLRHAAPELSVSVRPDPNYGLSVALREEFRTGFGSVSLIVAQSSFLAGKPVRWDKLKSLLLNTLPLH